MKLDAKYTQCFLPEGSVNGQAESPHSDVYRIDGPKTADEVLEAAVMCVEAIHSPSAQERVVTMPWRKV